MAHLLRATTSLSLDGGGGELAFKGGLVRLHDGRLFAPGSDGYAYIYEIYSRDLTKAWDDSDDGGGELRRGRFGVRQCDRVNLCRQSSDSSGASSNDTRRAYSCASTAGGRVIWVTMGDGTLVRWNAASGELDTYLPETLGAYYRASCVTKTSGAEPPAPDELLWISSPVNGHVRVLNPRSGNDLQPPIDLLPLAPASLCLSTDRRSIWIGCDKGTVLVFNSITRMRLRKVETGHTRRVDLLLAVAPNDVWTSSIDGRLGVWSSVGEHRLTFGSGHESRVTCLGVASNGRVWAGAFDGKIREFSGADCDSVREVESAHEKSVTGVLAWSDSVTVTVGEDGRLVVYESPLRRSRHAPSSIDRKLSHDMAGGTSVALRTAAMPIKKSSSATGVSTSPADEAISIPEGLSWHKVRDESPPTRSSSTPHLPLVGVGGGSKKHNKKSKAAAAHVGALNFAHVAVTDPGSPRGTQSPRKKWSKVGLGSRRKSNIAKSRGSVKSLADPERLLPASQDSWSTRSPDVPKWDEAVMGDEKSDSMFTLDNAQWHVELGRKGFSVQNALSHFCVFLQTVDSFMHHSPVYENQLFSLPHDNYVGECQKYGGPVIVSVERGSGSMPAPVCKVLIRTKSGDERLLLASKPSESSKKLLRHLRLRRPNLEEATLHLNRSQELKDRLLKFENRLIGRTQKVGVLYCREDQTTEQEIYSNIDMSIDCEEFFNFLGDRITLRGWSEFSGGLDVKGDRTGVESVFTKFTPLNIESDSQPGEYSIMFHVSTLLPYVAEDEQQLERKRFIGNDIVIVIFKEGNQQFDPNCIKAQFPHVLCIVQKVAHAPTRYRLHVASRSGVRPHQPHLPEDPVFEKSDSFRNFLLTKLINAERTAICAPSFCIRERRTRKTILADMVKEFSDE